SVTEGTILEWHKQEGDFVEEGETVVEVSTDKIDAEVPAPASGVIRKLLVEPDAVVQVGQALAEIDPAGDPSRDGSADDGPAEVPAPASGTITKLLVGPDDVVQVGQALAEMTAGAPPSGDGKPEAPAVDGAGARPAAPASEQAGMTGRPPGSLAAEEAAGTG